MIDNIEYGLERLKDIVEKEAREEEETTEQTKKEDNIDLTATENERPLKEAYRSFMIPGTTKADIDSYFNRTKSLIEDHQQRAQQIGGNTGDEYIRVAMPFNSLTTEFFQGSDIDGLIQRMFAHIKTQIENLQMPVITLSAYRCSVNTANGTLKRLAK